MTTAARTDGGAPSDRHSTDGRKAAGCSPAGVRVTARGRRRRRSPITTTTRQASTASPDAMSPPNTTR